MNSASMTGIEDRTPPPMNMNPSLQGVGVANGRHRILTRTRSGSGGGSGGGEATSAHTHSHSGLSAKGLALAALPRALIPLAPLTPSEAAAALNSSRTVSPSTRQSRAQAQAASGYHGPLHVGPHANVNVGEAYVYDAARSPLESALAKLMEVDAILEQLGLFWANTEVVLDVLTKKGIAGLTALHSLWHSPGPFSFSVCLPLPSST